MNQPLAQDVVLGAVPWGRLESQKFDLLVVGGGIVGAGVARDAAMRGLSTALVEQSDFASGTSSRSSRLLHGGIRYLAQGRLGLVREASREKIVLAKIAPHLSQPLPFIFPTRQRSGWPLWKLSIGVRVYDLLCGIKYLARSRSLDADETARLLPGLNRDRLTGSVRYFDALTNDSRLVLDTLDSAARHGAVACNYLRLEEAAPDGEGWRCTLTDAESGRSQTVRAKCVVNAAGPWSDSVPNSHTRLRLTKGVHLVVDGERFPLPAAVVIAEGSRILFAIPWGERVILGTTDTDYDGPLEEPPCEVDDVGYILAVVNDAFPGLQLGAKEVLSTWSGLRPLVADARGNPSDISRRHKIAMSNPGWWDVTGGKLTTYRLMAEETVDAVCRRLDGKFRPCTTAATPLLEGVDVASHSGVLPPPVSQQLVRRYCLVEGARRLADVMVRRTSWRHYRLDHLTIADAVAAWMADALEWSPQRVQAEIRSYRGANEEFVTAQSPRYT